MAKKEFSLKGLFVKDEETPVIEEKVVETEKKPTPKPTSLGNVSLVEPTSLTTPVVSQKERNEFSEFLSSIYTQGNFSGPDYQEFTDALKEVENEPMDEESKFKTIFVGFKVQGVTKQRLLETGSKYIALIQEQVIGFNSEIDNVLKTDVTSKQEKIAAFTKENAEIETQMRQLTERKNKNNESIQKITNEVDEQVSALGMKKASFSAAANDFINTINGNIEKIKQYLPEPKV